MGIQIIFFIECIVKRIPAAVSQFLFYFAKKAHFARIPFSNKYIVTITNAKTHVNVMERLL